MRFNLQEVNKSIHRRGSALVVKLFFLKPTDLVSEITCLIAYHEQMIGVPQKKFSLDEARACIGEYRLAHCLCATLSNWYRWSTRDWISVVREYTQNEDLLALSSPVPLRLALYDYVNEQQHGFVSAHNRAALLQGFAGRYQLTVEQLEDLLALDSDDEALLQRYGERPDVQQVMALYNQWVFEAALFSASHVRFVIDCAAFRAVDQQKERSGTVLPATGVGAVIKRLCFLARKPGVYYDFDYEASEDPTAPRLGLTLYGPQEVTGSSQQYGLRLARLCRTLLGYGLASRKNPRSARSVSLATGVIEAEAQVHFLQRSYSFVMDAELWQSVSASAALLPFGNEHPDATQVFDSGIEQLFAEAFLALAQARGADGWMLEREPEPLLLEKGIAIPDFALTRGRQRLYMEILGFWTPAYRERKVQKLLQLRGRTDLFLAVPVEAKEAFTDLAGDFPIVFYHDQLLVTDVLQLLRTRYDDFSIRTSEIDTSAVLARVRQVGLLDENECYRSLRCYNRSELLQVAGRFIESHADIGFLPGLGLFHHEWRTRFQQVLSTWMIEQSSIIPLQMALDEMKKRFPELLACGFEAFEALLTTCLDISVQHPSIFETTIALMQSLPDKEAEALDVVKAHDSVSDGEKKPTRTRGTVVKRPKNKKSEPVQGNLWE